MPHRDLMGRAVEHDGEAHRALLAGDGAHARAAFAAAARLYRESWEAAPPASYGRLVGMLKSSILAGDAHAEARYALHAIQGAAPDSPTAAYVAALASLVIGDDDEAARSASRMLGGSDAFDRAADAIIALGARNRGAYAATLHAIVRDFERREVHLTGVPIADTALMLEVLAAQRDMSAGIDSPLLPLP